MSMVNLETEYDEVLDYLYSFVDYSLTRQLRYSAEKFNLNRMRLLMEKLGNPQTSFPIIHVAGTKGKGSTAAFVASVLQQAGYKVGLYTSPHLHDYAERIQINRQPILHQDLIEEIDFLKKDVAEVSEITTFEITTAVAFHYFAREKVDIAVIEVGLGGRLDATNIVDPLISVITSLSYDHMNILGKTIEKITVEKAGIIKEDRPIVVAPQGYKQTYPILRKIASERNAPYFQVNEIIEYSAQNHSLDGQEILIREVNDSEKSDTLSISLLGFHQVENAATAYCVLEQLKRKGYKITQNDIKKGFASANWPCRFEIIQKKPLVIIDSAHNADSAKKLSSTVEDYLPGRKITLIFGASEDKDIKGMFDSLLLISDDIIMTKSIHPRAMEPGNLKVIAKEFGRVVTTTETLEEALDLAFEKNNEHAILITGSIFVAAAAKEIIQKRNQEKV
jgi:dihydrofolate synthase / folylpolyglutamate synthase